MATPTSSVANDGQQCFQSQNVSIRDGALHGEGVLGGGERGEEEGAEEGGEREIQGKENGEAKQSRERRKYFHMLHSSWFS